MALSISADANELQPCPVSPNGVPPKQIECGGDCPNSDQTDDRTDSYQLSDSKPTPTLPIRWESDVPTQRWMNRYTRVLSKFTSTPGLRVRVSFELPADSTVSDAKLEEARTALRELGLAENLG